MFGLMGNLPPNVTGFTATDAGCLAKWELADREKLNKYLIQKSI